jgi:ATP-dependent Clp protease ATP-binding subunit ClpX
MDNIHRSDIRCSFCQKRADEVRRILTNNGVYICSQCVSLCTEIVTEKPAEYDVDSAIPTPKQVKEYLDNYVIGQERAKKILAVAVYNHYKRISSKIVHSDIELQKSNIILIGPTGCGKTLLAQTLARILKVPFVIADATTLTEAGYVGEDVENIVKNLAVVANYDVEKASKGIVYIDEIDKLARRGEGPSVMRDVSGEGVQQALLKLFEGTKVKIQARGRRKHFDDDYITIDTSRILFISGGAFHGLKDIIQKRLDKGTMGFGAEIESKKEFHISEDSEDVHGIQTEDLLKFGMIPEFVGRVPVIACLKELTEDQLLDVLTKPKNAIVKQFEKLFKFEGVKLTFTDEALKTITEIAHKKKTGARGLRTIIENALMDIMYEIPSKENVIECVITEDVITSEAKPELITEKAKAEV